MEIKKRKVQTYKAQEEEIEVYVSEDKQEFNKKEDCLAHEEELKIINSIKKKELNINIYNFPSITFWYASNEEQLSFILKYLGWNGKYQHTYLNDKGSGMLNVGDWIGVHIEDGGDYPDDYYFYTWDFVKEKISKGMENAEK